MAKPSTTQEIHDFEYNLGEVTLNTGKYRLLLVNHDFTFSYTFQDWYEGSWYDITPGTGLEYTVKGYLLGELLHRLFVAPISPIYLSQAQVASHWGKQEPLLQIMEV